ncbi:MAG: hypothetical protein ACD_67C00131G0002 [uncultured bacterium]|nr:MAG: hypothetical protein ACD_67C00131G0002 [uncultured bacterium]
MSNVNFMLSKEEILNVATLARIGVSDKDVEKYQHDLSEILDYFKKLDELDVEGVEPIGHITGMQNTFRSDEQSDFGKIGREAIMRNVPEMKGEYIKVKSVL